MAPWRCRGDRTADVAARRSHIHDAASSVPLYRQSPGSTADHAKPSRGLIGAPQTGLAC